MVASAGWVDEGWYKSREPEFPIVDGALHCTDPLRDADNTAADMSDEE